MLQSCEVEVVVDEPVDAASYDLKLGARIYASEDATEFVAVTEKNFDLYQEEVEYKPEYEEPPVYEAPQKESKEEKQVEISPEKVNDEFADLIEAANANSADSTDVTDVQD